MKSYAMLKQALFITALSLASISLTAHNVPTFYKANFFGSTIKDNHSDLATFLTLRYAHGEARRGFNGTKHTTSNLNIYGPTNFSNLASNMENLTSKPVTNQYLNTSTGIIPGFNFTGNDGTIELRGKFTIDELDLMWHQNLFSGLYVYVYIPIRLMTTSSISYVNLTSSSNPNAAAFQSFLNNNLNTVLAENGYQSLTTTFRSSGLGDPIVYFGWEGYNNTAFNVINDLAGAVQVGILFPITPKRKVNNIAAIPRGSENAWAVSLRTYAEASFLKFFAAGLFGGADIFWTVTHYIRMKTDPNQSGFFFLEKGRSQMNPGSMWNFGGYLKIEGVKKAVCFTTGYSFAQREKTRLQVRDAKFLSTFIAANQASSSVVKQTKNNIVNSDERYKLWHQHTLHFMLAYDAAAHLNWRLAPHLAFFYDYPFLGKRVFRTAVIGGMLGFSANWDV